ncbi:MAG: hypothetical protein ACI8UP_003354 [Porticoccaceae bacterium]|jgi:hypothetical protein
MKLIRLRQKALLLTILVLLPIDWFAPTGLLFREAGAKPLNLFLLVCALFFLVAGRLITSVRIYPSIPIQGYLSGIIICGTGAFLINLAFMPPVPISDRSQIYQYITQTAMLFLFMIVLQVLIYIFSTAGSRQRVLELLPLAASIHLFFLILEGVGVFTGMSPGPLSLFRNENGLIDRPSGLMSEPSYFGVFAALYAVPMFIYGIRNKNFKRALAITLLAIAVLIQAKTMFIVLGAQLLYLASARKSSSIRKMIIVMMIAAVFAGVYLMMIGVTIDLSENLSSIMRLGSNMLTLNVATDGYGLIGLGTGQFHFMYTPKFAPDYLFLSQEALDQFSGSSGTRASTFNLPLRLLVESGLVGLLLALLMLFRTFWSLRHTTDPTTQTGLCFIAGSLGFLMTQDTYCLPSLAFGLALAITGARVSLRPN